MNYDNDSTLGLIVLTGLALAAAFLLTSCEQGDTTVYAPDADDGSSIEIHIGNGTNTTQNANK